VVVLPRDIDGPEFADARALGVRAVKALGLETGLHPHGVVPPRRRQPGHRRDRGPPAGRQHRAANGYAHDTDMYRAWARAVVDDAFDGPWERKYAVGVRLPARRRARRGCAVTGVDAANERWAPGGRVRLPTVGAPRADSYEGDGYVIVRDPDTEVVKAAVKTIIETRLTSPPLQFHDALAAHPRRARGLTAAARWVYGPHAGALRDVPVPGARK
jgi:hypothetical protein